MKEGIGVYSGAEPIPNHEIVLGSAEMLRDNADKLAWIGGMGSSEEGWNFINRTRILG